MAHVATYHWLRIRTAEREWSGGFERFTANAPADVAIWGAFSGLFGIGSNEMVLVVHTAGDAPVEALADAGFDVVESLALVPTVRPIAFEPLTRPGLYVFRFFDVDHADVDEIARLSDEAWTTFETASDYAAEPQALFAQVDRSAPTGAMLLVTWYDGLESWQTSRTPTPEAADRFRRRRALTHRTIAFATRLVDA